MNTIKKNMPRRASLCGLQGFTVTPRTIKGIDGWVLNYTWKGSSFVHSEEFTVLEKLNKRVSELTSKEGAGK